MVISIIGADGNVKASAEDTLVYSREYDYGDVITISGNGYVVLQAEDSIPPVFGYLKGTYELPVPFAEKKLSYSPKSFLGSLHLLTARSATGEEIALRRNLAFNPLDNQQNSGFFPHVCANIETRDDSVFAARNIVDGITTNTSHGEWPYQSWGIKRRDDAEITVDFGRNVVADCAVITLRADFPHDNWWTSCSCGFSDGSTCRLPLEKTARPQIFRFEPKIISSVTLRELIKCTDDPSPFPALTELEIWGTTQ